MGGKRGPLRTTPVHSQLWASFTHGSSSDHPVGSRSWSRDCLALECSPAMVQDGCWLGPSVPDDLVQGPPHLSFHLSDGLVFEPPQNCRKHAEGGAGAAPLPPSRPCPAPSPGGATDTLEHSPHRGRQLQRSNTFIPIRDADGPDPLQRRLGRRKGARV